MAKKEKSFFGKIMGGNITDEDTGSLYTEQSFTEPEYPAASELLEEEYSEEEYLGEVEQLLPVEQPNTQTQREPAKLEENNEEWVSDYEGQLNIDMYQTKDNVILKSTIAGVKPEDIDITVANDMVTIKGARIQEEVVAQDDYFYQECYWGNFTRSVIVPVDIDSENIEADLRDGILTVTIPKAAKAKTKRVKVKGL
jgi:HSP20 family protein